MVSLLYIAFCYAPLMTLAIDRGVVEEGKKRLRLNVALEHCFPTVNQTLDDIDKMVDEMKVDRHIVDRGMFL